MSALIAEFIRRYVREQDFHQRVAELVGLTLQRALRDQNLRSITSWRAKKADRLEKKLLDRQRLRLAEGKSEYRTEDEIYEDIPDLAGARVAMYFPDDGVAVGEIIASEFEQIQEPKRFPLPATALDDRARKRREGKRFSGYSAEHYRIRLRKDRLSPEDARFADGRCEIQVASVLMHAWAEVEHDLEYKDLSGTVSDAESALLDQLNGLVLAGELALEQLRRATETRTSGENPDAALRDQYDLANWLARADPNPAATGRTVGRADVAFRFLEKLHLTKVSDLARYRDSLKERLAEQCDGPYSLADQLVEVLREEDPTRDSHLLDARHEITAAEQQTAPAASPLAPLDAVALGIFLQHWRALEQALRSVLVRLDREVRGPIIVRRALSDLKLSGLVRQEVDRLNYVRAKAVHGTTDAPSAAQLLDGARTLRDLMRKLPDDAVDDATRGLLKTAVAEALASIPQADEPLAFGTSSLEVQAGPAIVHERAIIVPLEVSNPSPSATTISEIRLIVGDRVYLPSLPLGGLVVSGLPFRTVGTGIRLREQDAFKCAVYFGPSLDGEAVEIPPGRTEVTFELKSVRDGTISRNIPVHDE